ncbi:signal peptidase I [Bacillus sp. CRN 9]|nr:signal peptidase I [Bacillus sp. CRN 9]
MVGNLLFVILLVLGLLSLYAIIQGGKDSGTPPSIFGFSMMSVLTGSMEPDIKPGDLVVVKAADIESIQENEIITYKNGGTFVTHRVIDKVNLNGQTVLQTQGDANNIKDEGLVIDNQIIGSVQFTVPKGGAIAQFLISPLGLLIAFILVLWLIFSHQVKNFIPKRKLDEGEGS